jgi:hypothetical protein
MSHETVSHTKAGPRARWMALAALLPTLSLTAQQSTTTVVEPTYVQPDNLLLRWGILLLVLVAIWLGLYKVIYPYFLRYYRDDICKTIFWSLFILYSFTALFLSSYMLFGYGFYYIWIPWFGVFLAAGWLLVGLVLLMQRKTA